MRITSQKIAELCNVSRGTVDRALNGRPGVNEDTRQRILRVAQETGYTPNPLARSLATGRTNTVGVVIFDLRNRHFTQLVSAVEKEMTARGYFTYICLTEKDPDMERKLIGDLVQRKVEGIILHPVNNHLQLQHAARSLPVPLVAVSNKLPEANCYIGGNNRDAVYRAMGLFLEKGYECVYFVCPSLRKRETENIYAPAERERGYREFMHDHPVLSGDVILSENYVDEVESLIWHSKKKIAFFCGSDHYALAILSMARRRGLHSPQHFGLIGFDGVDTLEHIETKLTTVFYPAEEIGRRAAVALHNLMQSKSVSKELLFDCTLMSGETT